MNQTGKVRIGLSNAVVPGPKKNFPPPYQLRSRLHYYSHIFNTVEINSCFYKIPMLSTYERWVNEVPDDFRFTLKLNKEITHARELKADLACMNKFIKHAGGIGQKKGCLLVQFPGKISLDYFEQVEEILYQLQQEDLTDEWRKAVEFRNPGWYTGETWEMLNEYGATIVLHDMPKARIWEVKGKTRFLYLRFHGPAGDYRGSYSNEFLETKSAEIRDWVEKGIDVYVYFNNTAGDAFENARTLMKIQQQDQPFFR